MPLKTMLDAIVRDKGKDDTPDQKPAKDKDVLSDFSSMVRAVGPKLKLDKETAKPDKSLAELLDPGEPDEDKDGPDAPAQGIFGQAILAFEQLLDRQQHENSEQPQPAMRVRSTSGGDTVAQPMQSVEADQKSEKPAEISVPDNKSGKTDVKATDSQVAASLQDNQEPGRQVPHAGQDVAPTTQAPEAPKPKISSKAAPVEYVAPVDAATSAPSPSVQLEAKPTAPASNNAMPLQTSRRPITDVQILSDRSTPGARTLVVQLQPIELGTVTARMRLTPEGMHIQLMAENPAMAEHLAKDHDMLSKALQRAGAADDAASVTISVVDRSGASASAQSGQHNPSAQDQQPGARAGGQGQSGFQGTPGDRSGNQWPFAEMRSDERVEKATDPDIERRLSRGLVV
jgi:chemotaxis protein MotD